MGILKKIDTVIGVASIAFTAYDIMNDVFKWYEKKHGKNNKVGISSPIVKGL